MVDRIKDIFTNRKAGILGTYKKSAVMLLLNEGEKTELIFEVRSFNLRTQPGDICFPGGKVEQDESPKDAAIRETMEELNLNREEIEYIGSMDYIVTPYNFIMYPFIAKIKNAEIRPNSDEVDHIFKVPLEFFMENSPKVHEISITSKPGDEFPYYLIRNGRDYKFRTGKTIQYFYEYDGYVIWGFTALIIKHFVDIIKKGGNII